MDSTRPEDRFDRSRPAPPRARRARRPLLSGLLVAALTGTLTGTLAVIAPAGADAAAPVAATAPTYSTTTTAYTITARDGVKLAARVWAPKGATGKLPLVLIPSAWGGESGQMFYASDKLAARGFVAVNYATRGFKDSDGIVDLASPKDITDVSDIIDYSIAKLNADGDRVGMWGLSYGAGMSLLAAAAEPRLDAVGSLEGFTDMTRTAYPNRTRSTFMVSGLLFGAVVAGELSPELQKHFNTLITGEQPTGTELDQAVKYLAARSPINIVDRINRNGAAVFMATSWNDTAYGTDQVTEFYSKLTGRKRLEIRPGDHVVNEVPGSVGVGVGDGQMYNNLFDWMTTYVAGRDTAIVHQPAVWTVPRSSGPKPAVETFGSWNVPTGSRTLRLGAPSGLIPTGSLNSTLSSGASAWTRTLKTGGDVVGGVGVPVLNFAGEALGGTPPQVALWATDRSRSAVFLGAKEPTTLRLRGAQSLKFTVLPKAAKGTVMVYLYDADAAAPGGTGYIIGHRPYTFLGATPGKPLQITLPLQPTSYDLPAGHRLALGISTGDVIYADENPKNSSLDLVSTAQAPIELTVQTG